jgi:hypothetical protein
VSVPQVISLRCVNSRINPESHSRSSGRLRRPSFIGVFLGTEIQRRLNPRMTQNYLHRLGCTFALFNKQLDSG